MKTVNEPDVLYGRYTYADYLTWKFDEQVELIKGKNFKMSPAPRRVHQEVSGEIFYRIYDFLKVQKCKAFIAPFDVRLPIKSKNLLPYYNPIFV